MPIRTYEVVGSSGYNEQEVTQHFAGKDHAGFIQKPYTMARLKEALQAELAHRGHGVGAG